jgi:aryl-alcohol dehydrogenase-like predicted oxidoreductase
MTDVSTGTKASATITIGGDLTVRRLGFGAMRITGPGIWGEPPDHDEAVRVLRRAVDLGVNLIDTADSYGPHVSERLIAEALSPYPDDLVIATKGGLLRDGPNQWRPDGRPERLRAVCEESLQRLRLDTIAIYQFHRPDPQVPLTDSIGALVDLQREGKIHHLGICNVTEAELDEAIGVAPMVSVQNRYSGVDRSSDSLVDRCERDGRAFLPWAPLAFGQVGSDAGIGAIARAHQATPHQVAIAWLLARSPVIVPIPGTGSTAHLEENMGAATLELSPDEIATLAAGSGGT